MEGDGLEGKVEGDGLEGKVEGFVVESFTAESCIVGARVGVCIGDVVRRVGEKVPPTTASLESPLPPPLS